MTFPGSDVPLPPSMGGRYTGGMHDRAQRRRLALDRTLADMPDGETPEAVRDLRAPEDVTEATGTPFAALTTGRGLAGEPRVYLVVPGATGPSPSVMRLDAVREAVLDLGWTKVVVRLERDSEALGPHEEDMT